MPALADLLPQTQPYNYAFLDEQSKREIRRALLKAVAIPGYQVPFGSRELPIARGWGTGGIQVTLSCIGPGDTVKVIDQGTDAGVNALNIRRLVERTTGLPTTTDTEQATIIQTRHRIPEQPLRSDQIIVFQVPFPEPLRNVESSEAKTREMHAEQDYARMWVALYEDVVHAGEITKTSSYPAMVNGRHIFSPSPIPRWDLPKLHQAPFLALFGAGREKRIYAVPPYTDVVPLDFEDHPFTVENMAGRVCDRCGATGVYMDEFIQEDGSRLYRCSDTAYCDAMVDARARGDDARIAELKAVAR
jgi:alpha-D-ribose 1-methylphosphonate 5-phosphate C-P lyase